MDTVAARPPADSRRMDVAPLPPEQRYELRWMEAMRRAREDVRRSGECDPRRGGGPLLGKFGEFVAPDALSRCPQPANHAAQRGENPGRVFSPGNPPCGDSPLSDVLSKLLREVPSEDPKEEASWERRRKRERMRSTLRRLIYAGALPSHPVRDCRVRAIPAECRGRKTGASGQIELRHDETAMGDGVLIGGHSYHGRRCCGNMLVCPECAAEFGSAMRDMVRTAVGRLLQAGYCCIMLTLTARHARGDSLERISEGFQQARRWMAMHKAWRSIKADLGIIGEFSALEVTDDAPDAPAAAQTGYHWHVHKLLFYKPAGFEGWFEDNVAANIELRIRRIWQRALRRQGLSCSLEHGARLQLPRRKGIEMLKASGLYDGVLDPASVQAAVEYVSKGVTWEITGSSNATKKGRKAERITMWEALQRITDGDMSLVPRYAEYMQAVRGRAFMTWSRGLKAFCGLPEDEEDVIEQARKAMPVTDYVWSDRDFRSVARYAQATAIRRIADDAGAEAPAAIKNAMQLIDAGRSPTTGERLDEIGG